MKLSKKEARYLKNMDLMEATRKARREATPMNTTTKTIQATYHNGVLALKEPLALKEGEEVTVSIATSFSLSEDEKRERFRAAAGSWKDIVDEDLEEYLYTLRQVKTRPEVEPWQ